MVVLLCATWPVPSHRWLPWPSRHRVQDSCCYLICLQCIPVESSSQNSVALPVPGPGWIASLHQSCPVPLRYFLTGRITIMLVRLHLVECQLCVGVKLDNQYPRPLSSSRALNIHVTFGLSNVVTQERSRACIFI